MIWMKRSDSQRVIGDFALPPITVGTTRASSMSEHGAEPTTGPKMSRLISPPKNSSTTIGINSQRGVSFRM